MDRLVLSVITFLVVCSAPATANLSQGGSEVDLSRRDAYGVPAFALKAAKMYDSAGQPFNVLHEKDQEELFKTKLRFATSKQQKKEFRERLTQSQEKNKARNLDDEQLLETLKKESSERLRARQ